MPFAKPSDVPDNVPAAHKAQFMEVFNSAWKAAKDDKKSDAQADETSFAQAWGVITKAGAKPKRDVSSDGPGFGPVEKKDGGQAADPTQSLRALEEEVKAAFKRFSEDQARDSSGKWTAGSTYEEKLNHVSRLSNSQLKKEDEKLSKKSSEYTDKMIAAGRGDERPSDYVKKDDPLSKEGKELLDKQSAITHETHLRLGPGSFPQHLGAGGPRIKDRSLYEQTEERFAADQPRDPDGKFAAGSTGEDAHDTEGHLKAAADHTTLAKQEMAKGDKEHMKLHEAAAHAHLTAAFAHKETMAPLSAIAQTSSHTANTFPDEKVGRADSQTERTIEYRWGY